MTNSHLPLVAIMGRPNVGKSTLFNRLVVGRPALVHDTPGFTRDRRYDVVDYFGTEFRIVDTGGLDPEAESDAIGAGIHRQAFAALDEASVALFVVDGHAGMNPLDRELASSLRKRGMPVVIAVNKVDGPKRDIGVHEFYELSLGELFGVSAAHGRGIDAMLEALVKLLPEPKPTPPKVLDADDSGPLRIAFVGKPNVGKSSLVNCLLGAERSLVHDAPGTTTDPVDTPFEYEDRPYILVDTAGMRRRAKIDERTEQLSVSMALSHIRRCHVAVLVMDATEGPSVQDQRIAGAILDAGRALVVALNKVDLLGPGKGAEVRRAVADDLHFLKFAPPLFLSALRGEGLPAMMVQVDRAAMQHRRRIATAELNKFFAEVCETHPPPTQANRVVRIHYMTQAATRPPTFLVFVNRPKYLAASYQRFLKNQLRKRYGFEGTALRLVVKRKESHGSREH